MSGNPHKKKRYDPKNGSDTSTGTSHAPLTVPQSNYSMDGPANSQTLELHLYHVGVDSPMAVHKVYKVFYANAAHVPTVNQNNAQVRCDLMTITVHQIRHDTCEIQWVRLRKEVPAAGNNALVPEITRVNYRVLNEVNYLTPLELLKLEDNPAVYNGPVAITIIEI